MRKDDDWFGTLDIAHRTTAAWTDEDARQQFLAALAALEKALDEGPGPRGFSTIPGLHGFRHRVAPLSADERQWAERLGERLWNSMGTGRTYAEETLLGQVGVQASPYSLPFFRAALEFNRERDNFQLRRRRIALASIAFIARQTGDATAHAQFEAWLAHPDVSVRAEATALYGRIHLRDDGRLDDAALGPLKRVAYEDRAFAPRFLARGWLHTAGIPVPVEPPDGVYAFKASLGHTSRTVELKASQSLNPLASAILNAFGWDHDHLYEFALTGDLQDSRFILPDRDLDWFGSNWDFDAGPEQEQPTESQSPMTLPLGAFGFTRGHKFIFRYDFGDDHRFQVTVADIQEHRSPRMKYPRVVARTGKALEQYPSYD
ncbi:plasmid pRiA4b ORF-3 family protein [Archangium gephyra]|nr:plasmid pRiA4b ORF-3 family protein [Archangium gephyra]